MDGYQDQIARRREEILARMDAALDRAGRARGSAKLMAVSKTVGVEEVICALRAGYRLFGENRPQELLRKLEGLRGVEDIPGYRFDMIGNLQKNKINAVLGNATCIHSISSLHLAEAVSVRSERRMSVDPSLAPQDVLIEVNVSGEGTKSGFSPEGLRAAMDELRDLRGIRIRGLMTMAPRGDKGVARRTFAGLRLLRDEIERDHPDLDLGELSCGMSEDFEEALGEGSTLIRLGRMVFDPDFELE